MKVVGTGAPRMLTVRFKSCEVHTLRDELQHRRSAITEAAARAHSHSRAPGGAGAGDREVEDRHDELFLIWSLLDQLREHVPPGEPRQLVGPTWVLAPAIRGAAIEAVERLHLAVKEFAEAVRPPTPDELRAKVDAASALVATMIALDHAENYAVDD